MDIRSKLAEAERRYTDVLACVFVVLCLAHRLFAASRMFLNPEEAFSILISIDAGVPFLIDSPIIYSHPPLALLLFRLVQEFSYSDLAMKAPFVLSGALFPLVSYFWVKRKWGVMPAWISLYVLALSPNLFRLGLDARGFTLTLLLAAVALYGFERAVDEDSPSWMGASTVAIMLAIATEYMALWIWATAGVWFLLRMRERPTSRTTRTVWMLGQLMTITMISGLQMLRSRPLTRDGLDNVAAPLDYLSGQYLQAGQNPAAFLGEQTLAVFGYLFSSTAVGVVATGAFLAGLIAVWTGRTIRPDGRSRADAALLIGPFLLAAAAATFGLYPYGASRHSTHLMIFMAVGVAVGVAPLFRQRLAAVWLIGVLLAPAWYFHGPNDPGVVPRMNLPRRPFIEALDFLRTEIPRGATLMTDQEGAFVLSYYLEPERKWPRARRGVEFQAAGYTMFAPRWSHQSFEQIKRDLALLRERFGIGPEMPVWGIDTGFHSGARDSWDRQPEIREQLLTAREFGPATVIYRTPPFFENNGSPPVGDGGT